MNAPRPDDTPRETIPCRLCGAEAHLRFKRQVLQRYEVGYYRCAACESLQTADPYWLAESYADQRRVLDTGAAARVQALQQMVHAVWKLFSFPADARLLDWGGGDGLFTRMLRDVGIDAYSWDPYADNLYAAGFDGAPEQSYAMITAFEVWEHLPHPREELAQLFAQRPEVHIATTGLYTGQDERWPYLNPLTGRHVFFYSPKALRDLADRYGYRVMTARGKLLLFYRRPLSPVRQRILRAVLHGFRSRWLHLVFALQRPATLAMEDQRRNTQRMLDGKIWAATSAPKGNEQHGE